MKAFWKWFLKFFVSVVAGTLLFFLLMHFRLFGGITVLMYRGIAVLLLCCIIMAAALILLKRFAKLKVDAKDIFIFILSFLCANMVFFTLVPVTVERSVSVFMLSYMDSREQEAAQNPDASAVCTKEEIEEVFWDKYVQEFGAFEKRFDEQIVTGTIEKTGDGYVLTGRGHFMVDFFRFLGDVFDTDRRLLFDTEDD